MYKEISITSCIDILVDISQNNYFVDLTVKPSPPESYTVNDCHMYSACLHREYRESSLAGLNVNDLIGEDDYLA